MANKLKQVDRLSYSEGVKINIGDYESRDVHISYSSDVTDGEKVVDAFKRVKKVVRNRLHKEEKQMRLDAEGAVDFNTMGKLR